MSFPLFYFPHVVLREVFQSMDFGDLFCLALTSTNSFEMIKFYRWRFMEILVTNDLSNDEVDVIMNYRGASRLRLQIRQHTGTDLVTVNGKPVQFCRSGNRLSFNYENPEDGIKSLAEFLLDLLRIKTISGVKFDRNGFCTLDWVESRQSTLAAALPFGEMTAEEHLRLLANTNTRHLFTMSEPPIGFTFTGEFRPRELCWFRFGEWITVDNLLSMNTAVIKINLSKLTSLDVSQFLRAWIDGGCPWVKWLEIEMDGINLDDALEGLDTNFVTEKRDIEREFGYKSSFTSSFEIQQEDGSKALIGCKENYFLFSTD